jgi:hypothetical protein
LESQLILRKKSNAQRSSDHAKCLCWMEIALPPNKKHCKLFNIRHPFILTSHNLYAPLISTVIDRNRLGRVLHSTGRGRSGKAGKTMSSLDQVMEYVTAGVFLCDGLRQILSYERSPKAIEAPQTQRSFGVPYKTMVAIGLFEIVAALALVVPFGPWPRATLAPLAAMALALLTVIAGIDHLRRHISVAPTAVLFLLTVFVLVGHWEQLPTWFSF